jgi:hypothetical protein
MMHGQKNINLCIADIRAVKMNYSGYAACACQPCEQSMCLSEVG